MAEFESITEIYTIIVVKIGIGKTQFALQLRNRDWNQTKPNLPCNSSPRRSIRRRYDSRREQRGDAEAASSGLESPTAEGFPPNGDGEVSPMPETSDPLGSSSRSSTHTTFSLLN